MSHGCGKLQVNKLPDVIFYFSQLDKYLCVFVCVCVCAFTFM